MSAPTREAGRELDALVAEKVMGWTPDTEEDGLRFWTRPDGMPVWLGRGLFSMPYYSTDIRAAMDIVAEVQRQHPGWRFSLLGGDVTMGYLDGSPKKGVDESSRYAFGWHAEFFGHVDPRQDYGDRHGEAEADTAPLAICLGALQAVEPTCE